MKLMSVSFKDGAAIPLEHAYDGRNLSPSLIWSEVPEGVRSFALIVDDPDAPGGTFTHWLLYDLPANIKGLPEGVPKGPTALLDAKQGVNGFGRLGYDGPRPPVGPSHRYYFTLYALDGPLGLKPGAGKDQVERVLSGHVIASASLRGTFKTAVLRRLARVLLRR
jgi:Raf kinase inhibitor-like YbhB/YbcL family protein